MQLRRAVEIMNSNNKENTVVYYNDRPVTIESIEQDGEMKAAYIRTLDDNARLEVNLEQLHERMES
jgi:H-type small acid-soluble spore protein